MEDLRSQLRAWRGRRLWLLGVGNPGRGDDGFGVRLVEELRLALGDRDASLRLENVGTCPERYAGLAAQGGCQELVFADAVDFGAAPGALLLVPTAELSTRRIGTSTHRVPLPVLAQYAEGLGLRAWILGVQPASLREGDPLSPQVAGTLEAVVELMAAALALPGDGDRTPEAPRARARARSRADEEAGVDR